MRPVRDVPVGWVNKKDTVLLDDAILYFTSVKGSDRGIGVMSRACKAGVLYGIYGNVGTVEQLRPR